MFLVILMSACVTAFGNAQSTQNTPPVLSLAAALAHANAHNPEVLAAGKQIEVAQAVLTATAPNPLQFQVAQGTTRDVPQGLGTLQAFTTGATQEFSPALGAKRSAASSSIRIAEAQFAAMRRDVDERVIAAYYALASAQVLVAAMQQSLLNAQELAKSAAVRARVGAAGSFEVLRAEVESSRVRTDLRRAQSGARIAQIALNVLMGEAANASTSVELTSVPISTPDIEALYAQATRIDPLIAQYRATADQAVAEKHAAQLPRLPSIGFQTGYLFQRAPDARGAISRGPTASVTLSLPLIDFGTIRGTVRIAQAQESIAQTQLQGRAASLESEVAQDVELLESAQAQLSFSQAALGQAQEGVRLAEFGYARGALGVLDVFSARNELAVAQAQVTQASADQAAAYARLQLITGELTLP